MKNLSFFLTALMILILPATLFSQQGLNYQAVVRNASGAILSNQNITVGFEIRETAPGGTLIYSEQHNTSTDSVGIVNLVIGTGTPGTGVFGDVDWGADSHFLQIKINGNTMGTIEFQYVPYSLHAQTLTNIKTNTTVADLEMTSDDDFAELHLRPLNVSVNDSSAIFLGEGSSSDFGMTFVYNGATDRLKLYGRAGGSNIGPHLTITRNGGDAKFTQAVEVEETSSSPDPMKVYGNSVPIAYGYVSGTTISQDYGVASVTNSTTGVYEITLDNSYTGSPVVIATAYNTLNDTEIPVYSYTTPNKIFIRFVNESNAAINTNFSFMVFGVPQ